MTERALNMPVVVQQEPEYTVLHLGKTGLSIRDAEPWELFAYGEQRFVLDRGDQPVSRGNFVSVLGSAKNQLGL